MSNTSKLTIIKVGGSVVTEKAKRFTINKDNLRKISEDIARLYHEGWSIVVVHGGGSFGHPVAALYRLNEGGIGGRKLYGFAETRYWMSVLNLRVVKALLDEDVPASSLQTSAVAFNDNKMLDYVNVEVVLEFVKRRIVPVLYGDVVIDKSLGASILSGDDLASTLAIKLNATSLVYVMGSGGIYSEPPSKPGAVLLRKITPSTKICVGGVRGIDVTDGVRRKILCAFEAARRGIRVSIGGVNTLYSMVVGKEGRYTQVKV